MAEQSAAAPRSRRLKISYSSYPSNVCKPIRPVPYLRLRGFWLAQAGFHVDQNVRIDIEAGRITIVPMDGGNE